MLIPAYVYDMWLSPVRCKIPTRFQSTILLLLAALLLANCPLHARENHSTTLSADKTDIASIHAAIQEQLAVYNEAFPDIQFVHLRNGEWEKSLQALELLIGYQATNLDYEHPLELREDLLFVTVAKIQMMLVNKMASSYLFKAGQMPATSRSHICVITLPPASVASNQQATRSFIDLPADILASLPASAYLDKTQHLQFILDHEAYHCLDTFHDGGIPMSDKDFSTRYDCFKRENRADMFAIAMNIRRHRKPTSYVNNVMTLRGMTLINGEMQHDSSRAMQLVLNANQDTIVNSQPPALLQQVKLLYQTIEPDYEEYLDFRRAAVEAIQQLGKQVNEYETPFAPTDHKPDPEKVQQLVDQTRNYYRQYVGTEYLLPTH